MKQFLPSIVSLQSEQNMNTDLYQNLFSQLLFHLEDTRRIRYTTNPFISYIVDAWQDRVVNRCKNDRMPFVVPRPSITSSFVYTPSCNLLSRECNPLTDPPRATVTVTFWMSFYSAKRRLIAKRVPDSAYPHSCRNLTGRLGDPPAVRHPARVWPATGHVTSGTRKRLPLVNSSNVWGSCLWPPWL